MSKSITVAMTGASGAPYTIRLLEQILQAGFHVQFLCSQPGQIVLAMELICGRTPTDKELSDLMNYAAEHGLPNLCRMLFNLSEFVYLD